MHNFTNPKLQILQMHGHFRFCHQIEVVADAVYIYANPNARSLVLL